MRTPSFADAYHCGIIDVGSNTIRAEVYEINGEEYRSVADHRKFSSLLTCVRDRMLPKNAIEMLCRVLMEMKSFCEAWSCAEIECFATASLRGILNFEEVRLYAAQAGIRLELLSGEEEALCDFEGLVRGGGLQSRRPETGVGIDLGGGSCQIFKFRNRELLAYASFPIGVMAMKQKFSYNCSPGYEKAEEIRKYVSESLDGCEGLRNGSDGSLYVMGGTVRAAFQAWRFLTGGTAPVPSEDALTTDQMQQLFDALSRPEGRRAVLDADEDRLPSMGSGLIILKTICEYVGAERAVIVRSGVREGYLWKNIMKRTRTGAM